MSKDTKLCPFCSEEIKTAAIKCKHCGRMLKDAAPREGTPLKSPPIAPAQPPPPSSEVTENELEPKPKPEPKLVYSIVIKNIESDKAKHLFAKKLNAVFKIPFAKTNDFVVPGRDIQSGLTEPDAQAKIQALSTPGIQLTLEGKVGTGTRKKKLFWAIPILLLSVILSVYSLKYLNYQSPWSAEDERYKKCLDTCVGEPHCKDMCKCLIAFSKCLKSCGDDDVCSDKCSDQETRCIVGYLCWDKCSAQGERCFVECFVNWGFDLEGLKNQKKELYRRLKAILIIDEGLTEEEAIIFIEDLLAEED